MDPPSPCPSPPPPQAELGDDYQLFLLEDSEGKPTAVVLPRGSSNEGSISKLTEVWLAVLFAVLSAVTTANANGVPLFQFLVDPFHTEISAGDVGDAYVPALAFWYILGTRGGRDEGRPAAMIRGVLSVTFRSPAPSRRESSNAV